MGGRPSKHIHTHVHIHGLNQEQPSKCSCGHSPPPSTSSGPSSQYPSYKINGDDFESLEQVTDALEKAGLESSNLIIGIDFTKSNEWTGTKSFMGRNLHDLAGAFLNPYEQAISIIGRTLEKFDDDNIIPCYGFGDVTTGDREVFSFHPDDRPCHGFEEVLFCYRERVPHVKLAGPTSFAPIIRNAIRIVNDSGGQYHILLIIADGQVTRSIDTRPGHLSPQEQSTIDAIVEASKYPLSIILVGVGDGPWGQMNECDDQIPARDFDNFQFVNFTEIMSKGTSPSKKETEFALQCLMEIPPQYKETMRLQLLGQKRETQEHLPFPLPRPPPFINNFRNYSPSYRRTDSDITSASFSGPSSPAHSILSRSSTWSSSPSFNRICPKCYFNEKDLAFGCGHQTCSDCGKDLIFCPTCQTQITKSIKLRN
ncbi:E3 ubiquitin-protein ligase RGLG2-like [Benincasa hispida]|uniref:E3 ubiquitin-protein ligase RGLG2-like n=1 Tax=Benincasa hispida TaxID=102211 RepID=UPI0019006459|nr:E3 ubiquitin-protein ligase RGLG2-like [Benincasa hispida]XP_038881535.1 E3 ubiquitin-protein ligase RGLG2-like [Benincasa hispida]